MTILLQFFQCSIQEFVDAFKGKQITAQGRKIIHPVQALVSDHKAHRNLNLSEMGRWLTVSSSTVAPLRFSQKSPFVIAYNRPKVSLPMSSNANSRPCIGSNFGFCRTLSFTFRATRTLCTKAVLSEVPNQSQFSKFGAESTGPIPSEQLLQVAATAAKTGAQVVMDAVNKPRNIVYKEGQTDLVTDTDRMSESAILDVIRKNFQDHLILGEEGGIIGDSSSDYLWCIDPLDGTTNFAHCYPSFAVSVGVLFSGKPAAAAVVEFVGGPKCWNTRTFSAAAGKGATCNGEKIHVSPTDKVERSLLVTGFGYEHDDAWATNIELFKEFTDVSRGVRRLGAAAVDMCHVALGIVEAYWEYRLKPWDMAAGVLIVEEAGGTVSCMDGAKFSVFDRSVLVSNGVLHAKLLERIGSATEKLKMKGIDFSLWYKPENYHTQL